jgi:hypothetical protein
MVNVAEKETHYKVYFFVVLYNGAVRISGSIAMVFRINSKLGRIWK